MSTIAPPASADAPQCRALAPVAAHGPIVGAAHRCPRTAARDLPYYLHLPPEGGEGAPVLVAVHGVSRDARAQVRAFGSQAARQGMVTVAPRFSRRRFPAYQRLGHSRRGILSLPQRALEEVLEEVAHDTGADVSRVFLFGFSGGAQFAHRYAMRHPERVRAVALGSAGWYTFPDAGLAFPRGLGATPLAAGFDPGRFLRVPALVLVGAEDVRRDGAFNASPRLDLEQGHTRIERARRWHEAMRGAARRAGIAPRQELALMPGCGHDFVRCVRDGDLVRRVLDFFLRQSRRDIQGARPRASAPGHLLFSAGG